MSQQISISKINQNFSTQQKVLELLKELTQIRPISFNESQQFIRLKDIKNSFVSDCNSNKFSIGQIQSDLQNIQAQIKQKTVKNQVCKNKRVKSILENTQETISDFQEYLIEQRSKVQQNVKNYRSKCLQTKISLKESEQIQKINENILQSTMNSKLQLLQNRIQSLESPQNELFLNIKGQFRHLKEKIQHQKKKIDTQQKLFFESLKQMDNSLSAQIAVEKEVQATHFASHYQTLERIFSVVAQDLA